MARRSPSGTFNNHHRTTTMKFTTLVYEHEHNRKPRGRGSWAFCRWSKHNAHDYLDHTVFSPGGMTLTEAKQWATRQASDPVSQQGQKLIIGRETIVIMP